MGLVKGLKAINQHVEAEDNKYNGSGDSTPIKWFKLADKQKVKVIFLQELDPDSENFSTKNDLGFLAVEHVNPKNWRQKAVCTADDGGCYGCEMHRKDWKAGWKQKTRLYINVLVDDGKNDPYVAIISQGNGPKSITPVLIEYATDDGTITDKWFNISRSGAGATDTSYTLRGGSSHDKDVESFELFDLEKALRQIPYEQQEAHYLSGQEPEETVTESTAAMATASASGAEAEW